MPQGLLNINNNAEIWGVFWQGEQFEHYTNKNLYIAPFSIHNKCSEMILKSYIVHKKDSTNFIHKSKFYFFSQQKSMNPPQNVFCLGWTFNRTTHFTWCMYVCALLYVLHF
jgi:hypothetical protein